MQVLSIKYKAFRQCLAFMIAVLFLGSFARVALPKAFTDLLSRADMTFEAPDSLLPTAIIQSRSMAYEYALKYPGKNFEVRYAVRPNDELWNDYEHSDKNPFTNKIVNPDSIYLSAFQTIILNCSGGKLPDITAFEKAAVKAEFGADWGGTVFIQPRAEFGQSYKYCMIVALHKNKAGDAYIFYLSDSQDGFNQAMAPAFHSLRFNNL